MNFVHPKILWLLAIGVPLLALFLYACWRRKQKLMDAFVQSRLQAALAVGVSRPVQLLRLYLLVGAVALLLFALARPRWGYGYEEAVHIGRDIIVAVDVSKSMLAADVQPDRITRARLAALDLARLSKSDRLGLVAFAGTAFLQCPLTLDLEAFRQSVEILEPGVIPEGGSVLSAAIDAATEAFEKNDDNHKALILITDGEAHETDTVQVAKAAFDKGLRIFTLGVGTPNGHVIQIRDEQGQTSYLKDEQGNVVKSSLNDKLLQDIAAAAGGFYMPLQGADTMATLYQRGLAPLPTTEFSNKMIKQWKERFQIPLSIAIILLLIEILLPEKKRALSVARPSRSPQAATVVLALIAFFSPAAFASKSSAQRAYNAGQYDEARRAYDELLLKKPNDTALSYNAGAAAFKAGAFDEAFKRFHAATTAEDLDLQNKAYYNAGNSLYRLGEIAGAPDKTIPVWEQAVKNYESALKLNPTDADAEHNLSVVRQQLEELKKQQQQQQKQNKQDPNKDDKGEPGDNKDQSDQKQDQESKEGGKDQQQKDQEEQGSKGKSNEEKEDEQGQPKDQPSNESEQEKEKQDQQQPGKDEEPKESGNQDQTQRGDKQKPGEDPGEAGDSDQTANATLGKMTPQQARQLLESHKDEERTFIFRPTKADEKGKRTTNAGERKDW